LLKADTTRPRPFQEFGSSGLTRFGGNVRQEMLRDLQGKRGRIKYQEMRRNNPVIAAVFFAVESFLREVSFFAEAASDDSADQEAAEFLDQCLDDMSFTWDDELLFILTMLEQGFMPLEIVYKLRRGRKPGRYGGLKDPAKSKYDDGKVGWRKWAPRPPASLVPGNEWIFDDAGGVQGINQEVTGGKLSSVPIPIEKLLLFRTTPAPSNSPEGQSLLRPMYQPYYYVENIQEIEGIGVERDLAGLPVVYLGDGTTKSSDANSDYKMAIELVENIRNDEQAGIVFPHPKLDSNGRGILLELLSASGTKSFDTEMIINRYERRMAMTLLAQFIMLGMEKVGSYSLSSTQSDVFAVALGAWAKYIAETIALHAVPRLFVMNPTFASLEELPTLSYSVIGKPDLVELAKYVNMLSGSMVLTPDEGLEDYLREAAHLPPRQETAALALPPAVLPETSTDDEMEEATGEDDLSVAEKTAGWMQRTYSRWLSEVAPRIVASDRKQVILKAALTALCKRLDMDSVSEDLSSLAEGPEHVAGEPLPTTVARKLAHVLDGDESDILAAGASLLGRFADVTSTERGAMQKALVDKQLERIIMATLEAGDR
jgi:hypothetical protein